LGEGKKRKARLALNLKKEKERKMAERAKHRGKYTARLTKYSGKMRT